MSKKKQPNIIFVLADQLRYQSCGYTGDPYAITPHIDKLAKEGTNLNNAVSSMPVCSAYRASLMTGKYTTSTGMVINELRLNPNHRCLAHVLTEGGYDTAYIGKWHLWANELGNHDDPRNSYVPPGPYRLGFDGYWASYNFRHDYTPDVAYYHEDTSEKKPYHTYEPDAQTDMAIDYITHAGKDKPYALFLSVGTPHDPWETSNVPESYYDMFKDVDFHLPPNYQEELDPYGDNWSNIAKTPELINQWKRVYYAMTTNLDYNIGRIMETIRTLNQEEETLIIFTSDHGEMFGSHGRMKKNTFYEESVRVPFLLKWKGHIREDNISDLCISSVDIMPTLLGLVNLPIPSLVEGSDVSSLLLDGEGIEPNYAFLQNTGACAEWKNGHEWRGIRDKRYTYAIYKKDGSEHLYDHTADPYQLQNLAYDTAYTMELNRYRDLLHKKMISIHDNFEYSTWYRDHWIIDRCIHI